MKGCTFTSFHFPDHSVANYVNGFADQPLHASTSWQFTQEFDFSTTKRNRENFVLKFIFIKQKILPELLAIMYLGQLGLSISY